MSPLQVTNVSDDQKTPEKMVLPPLLSSACDSVKGFKDFNNDAQFDSDSKDKHVRPYGYQSLKEEEALTLKVTPYE